LTFIDVDWGVGFRRIADIPVGAMEISDPTLTGGRVFATFLTETGA
jgi:hypothetical protein